VDGNHDCEVGYKKPPKNSQFQKGQSGNPKGRPKGSRNIPEILQKACHKPVRVKGENGRSYYMSKIEAVITQIMNNAAKYDPKAIKALVDLLKAFPVLMQPPPLPPPVLQVRFVKSDGNGGIAREEQDKD
jgi:hypothetical protein